MRSHLIKLMLSVSAFASAASAQDAFVPALPEGAASLQESFDKERDVSTGSPLVGLVYGEADGPYPVDGAIVTRPPMTPEARVCVHQTSKDGRYSSSNPYAPARGAVGNGAASSHAINIAPLSQAFAADLQGYEARDVGFLAYRAEGSACPIKDALYLPRILDQAGPLRLFAASRARSVRAELQPSGGDAIRAACRPVERPAVTYDVACQFNGLNPSSATQAELRLMFDDGFAVETRRYEVLIPAGAVR